MPQRTRTQTQRQEVTALGCLGARSFSHAIHRRHHVHTDGVAWHFNSDPPYGNTIKFENGTV